MYSALVCDRRIEQAARRLGVSLARHSARSCDAAVSHLRDVLDLETGELRRELDPAERAWIRNERVVCQLDFRYYITRYAKIVDSTGHLVTCCPNIAQQIKLDIWADLEEQGRSIEEMDNKARQLGVSTITELAVAHRASFWKHVNAVVASSDPDKSAKMSRMMELAWDNQPWWLTPRFTVYRRGELIEFGDLGSAVSIQHGTQFSGIARGSTPTVAHLSEVCDYEDPEELIDASLLRATHPSPWLFIVLESTSKGLNNWWHRTWNFSKENWALGRARLCPLFLPWYVGRDLYPTDTWLLGHPLPYDWQPAALTVAHAERARRYVHASPLLRKYLGDEWTLPREQMWFWEVTRAEYAAKGELPQFHMELCGDDLESFQSTNVSVFDHEVIEVYQENIPGAPVGVYGIVGQELDIPLRLQPSRQEIDSALPPVTVRCDWNPTATPRQYDFVPLRFRGYPATDFTNKLFVFELPEDDELYGIGVDTSDGVGLDRSVIEACRKGNHERNDAQVAEFASAYVNAFDLAPIALAISTFYSPCVLGVRRQAKVVIECRGNGESTQLEMRKQGWANFHQWVRYDSKRIRQSQAHKLGWFTNSWSRPMMLDFLVKALRDQWLDINSPWFVEEMKTLERDEWHQSIRSGYGGKDDRIMALGFVFFSLHVLEIRGGQSMVFRERERERKEEGGYTKWSPGWQGSDSMDPDSPIRSYLQQMEDAVGTEG